MIRQIKGISMSNRYLLKLNFLTFLVEVYTITALLFEVKVPGSDYLTCNSHIELALSLLPLALALLSKYTEGWTTITIPTLLCSVMIPLAASLKGLMKLSFSGLAAFLAIAQANCIAFFPVMKLIKPTGKFSVGYKDYDGKDGFKYCVFYPTLHPTKKRPTLISDSRAMKKYHEIAQGKTGDFPPRWFFEIIAHIYTKVKLYAGIDSPIATQEELKANINRDKMIPVIFSHGLGAAKHNYASILSQLASRGFFVISIDHDDAVKSIFQGTMENAQKHLGCRLKELRRMFEDLFSETGTVAGLFGGKINLDMSRLTLMAHSYGGPTTYLVAWEDERVKNLVVLDPWFPPIQRESLDRRLNCNILIFESENWSDMYPGDGIHERNIQVVEAQRESKAGAVYCRIPESEHNHFSDDFLIVGGVFKRLNVIKSIATAKKVYEVTIKALDDFFELVVAKAEGQEEFDKFMELYKGNKMFPLVKY